MVSMTLTNLLKETLDVDCDEIWKNERTPIPVRVFWVRLHSMGLSVGEVCKQRRLVRGSQPDTIGSVDEIVGLKTTNDL